MTMPMKRVGIFQVVRAAFFASILVTLRNFWNNVANVQTADAQESASFFDLQVRQENEVIVVVDQQSIAAGEATTTVALSQVPFRSVVASPPAKVIAYAVSITKCTPGDGQIDQAAVLLYSIHRNSIRTPESGSKYDYRAYAFVHPEATNCTELFERIGYEVQVLESPVLRSEMRGPLKQFVGMFSCCGEKEFLKLYSYTLIDHEVVTHLDLDCMVLQPLDDLYDSMIDGPSSEARQRLSLQWAKNVSDLPHDIEAFFTRDYNMVPPGSRQPHQMGVQGGFIIVKPDMDVFQLYKDTILKGNFKFPDGWGGKELKYGGYYGAPQIQGLCAYFFGHVRPEKSVELNHCYYNFMGDPPREKAKPQRCRTLENDCQDCRTVPFETIRTVHFTICTKTWRCFADEETHLRKDKLGGAEAFELCLAAHKQWFKSRYLLEKLWSERDDGYSITPEIFTQHKHSKLGLKYDEMATMGFCARAPIPGEELQYIPMKVPKTKIEL